ncbi:MAG: 50S ribosomal protein L5 [Bacteroidetes bacterium]|jgi:large subunit ribosomal protein L5|nr:50S ribosomal protein L5 [Bacteroidota bacterium]MBT5527908.1 50S ribosomal protein L5 [Cytophagia bacterium]MBT3424925.1 50S ribosomal protein L5 [Bacteroidota bacterium]MBT3933963.1 50S ribosomal protein L5 [Bacteroidota bacterium]MBT4338246.1 50S ribosomal protein L5 [Bacteroidota bacterium]
MKYVPEYKRKYIEEVSPVLFEKLGYTNKMEIPKLQKISLNQGVNGAVADKRLVDKAVDELTLIAGQKAVPTYARKSVSNFKLREGMPIGVKVTLRGDRMWEFLERLVSVSLPRVRDFRGINDKGFDGRGNYSFGILEQIIFAEIDIDKVSKINGLDITLVTSAKTDKEAHLLLSELGLPFKNKNQE